jgi:hypothetical protein
VWAGERQREAKGENMGEASAIRNFGQLLQGLEGGQLLVDLGDKLAELNGKLVRVAGAQGKAKGELVLKVKLNADAGGTVQIDAEITCKEPKLVRERTVLWLTQDAILTPDNPKQVKLALREVAAPKAARAVPAYDRETGEVAT